MVKITIKSVRGTYEEM